VSYGTVDLYSSMTQYKEAGFQKSDLAAGTHVIRIVATGTKSSAATNKLVNLDAFIVA
jgi:hypothetical protein